MDRRTDARLQVRTHLLIAFFAQKNLRSLQLAARSFRLHSADIFRVRVPARIMIIRSKTDHNGTITVMVPLLCCGVPDGVCIGFHVSDRERRFRMCLCNNNAHIKDMAAWCDLKS